MRILRRVSILSVVLAVTPLCFAGELGGESNHLSAAEVVAPERLMVAAASFVELGQANLPAVGTMEPQDLAAVADFFDQLKPDWMVDAPASSAIAPQSASGGCYYACFDLQESGSYCPPGQNYAFEATGPTYNCYIVGGAGTCISSGCAALISNCRGFAVNCGGGGGF
ncbi:MAG: hypothetical protein AAF657_24675 [Acidobacteriota bacterium]